MKCMIMVGCHRGRNTNPSIDKMSMTFSWEDILACPSGKSTAVNIIIDGWTMTGHLNLTAQLCYSVSYDVCVKKVMLDDSAKP